MTRSDRGVSMDETHPDANQDNVMKLKKTTVLTGNHALKQ